MSGVAGWQSPLAFWGPEARSFFMYCRLQCQVLSKFRYVLISTASLTGEPEVSSRDVMLVLELLDSLD